MQSMTFGDSFEGGCSDRVRIHSKDVTVKNRTLKIVSPKSDGNNCLLQCFKMHLGKKGNQMKSASIRKELGIYEGKIHFTMVPLVASYFGVGHILMNDKHEILSQNDPESENCCHIMLSADHYYLVYRKEYDWCHECGRKFDMAKKHVCNSHCVSYKNRFLDGKKDVVFSKNIQEKEIIDDDSMIFFDLETFQDGAFHVPYACGYCIGNGEVKKDYGKNCMNNFINLLCSVKGKTICAYNGAGFDFYMLINRLVDKGIEIDTKSFILSNGALLSFHFNGNKVFDLYRFIMTGLDKACKDYKIENKKLKFDVCKVQSWEDVDKYKDEVYPYLEYDVKSLRELFFTFNKSMFEMEKINITSYITLSHMGYSIWTSSLKSVHEIPTLDKYNFIKKGTYGARCYPQKRNFKSQHYESVINKKMSQKELLQTGDFIYNADATSLYPASMKGFEHCKVSYPVGRSRWSNAPELDFEAGCIGYYEIEFTCPKRIRVPVLPRKTEIGGLEWSLGSSITKKD